MRHADMQRCGMQRCGHGHADTQTWKCRHGHTDVDMHMQTRTCKHAAKKTWTCRNAIMDLQTWMRRHAWDLWVMTGTSKIVKRQVDLDMLTETCRHADMNMQAWTCRNACMDIQTWVCRHDLGLVGYDRSKIVKKSGMDMQTCS